ncbi:F-box only protein 36 isoform X1 [Harpia harpyja]|uniref:F-box only protein 36 isoform X1 n=1 Tax=Harpia harpyja TaxID=202280 RepID=UPI0022B1E5DD|nr:F-box only protein 36 isoform X1 [Harpia harpyja]
MASLLLEEVFETRGQAPAPSKDFCQLLVARREVVRPLSLLLSVLGNLGSNSAFVLPKVIFRWWKISLRNEFHESRPGEIKESQEDFLDDSSLHIQIAIVFDARVLEHVLNLCRGNYDFLEWLPVPLLLYIISFLELEDIARLSQVSHSFEMICNSNALCKNIVENLCDTITPEMKELAQEMGWKQFFFTNRLQLQLQLQRRRQKQDAQNKKITE